MYRGNNIRITNNHCSYTFHVEDEKYVRDPERHEFFEKLCNGGDVSKFVDPGRVRNEPIPFRCGPPTAVTVGDLGKRKWEESEDCSKQLKQCTSRKTTKTKNSVPGDRDESGTRIFPVTPSTFKNEKDYRSYKKWLTCWNKVMDMNDKRNKDLKSKGKLSEYKKLIWPEWTSTWKKRKGDMWWWDLDGNEKRIETFKKQLAERAMRGPRYPDTDEEEYPTEDEVEYDSDHWEPDCEFSDME